MLAVKGIYRDGQVTLENKLPVKSAEVIVVFPDTDEQNAEVDLSVKARRKLFEEFSGSVNRIIDEKAEKVEAVSEERFCEMLRRDIC